MFAKWKSKIKAAIKEAKDKRNGRNSKHSGSEALAEPVVTIEKQSDGLSRPYGLGGRKSVDLPAAAQAANNAGYPAAAMSGASLGTAAEQQDLQQQHQQAQGDSAALPQQQQQLDTQHASMMAQHHQHHQQHMHGHASGLRPLDCADRNTHGVDVLMRSCPGSPVAPGHHPAAAGALQDTPPAGNHHASTAPNGSSSAGGPSTRQIDPSGATASGQTSPEAAGLGLAGDNSELGSTLGGVPTSQHRLDASRTPKDEDLGSCPPYAAKAVWGLRYTMEDKWAAVPNLIQVPLVLTMPAKKSKGSKSGCGCMIPAASKVLAKVSPSSRLGSSSSSAGKDKDKDASRASGLQAPSPGLEKASPDRQRLIGHGLSSSDEQGAAAAHAAAGDGSSGGSLGPLPGMDALHYFGVFDGHGGADAARYCAQRMHQVVCNTIMSMLSPEVAATAVCSALATCRQSNTDLPAEQLLHLHRHQQQQQQQGHPHQQQQQPGEAAAPLSAGDGAPAAAAGGSNAAAAAAAEQQLLPAIDIVASNGSWVLPALSRSFVTLDHEFGAISEGSYVGSTAVVVLVGGQRLWVAHAGDSRAVLGRAGALQVLTSDHKASRDDEVARVQAAGGHVWWDRVMGELAVSRAIGDHCLRPYVIPEPELLMVERTPDDEVLVMASDGLWDVMNNQEAVDMALHSLQAAQASGHVGVAAVKRSANALTKAALERGTRDNVTVLVVDLRPRKAGTYEAAASSSHHGSRHGSSSSGRGHSSSKSSSKSSSRSSKKGAAAAAPAAAATPLAATGASAAAAAASECVPGVTADSAAGVTPAAAAAAAAREAAAASIGGLQTPSAGTSESSLASAAAAAPADAAAVPAAGTGAGTLPAVQPAAAEAEGPAAAGAAQLSRAASGSTGETHSLIQPHESSSHGAGI